jgi:hypothetical protein
MRNNPKGKNESAQIHQNPGVSNSQPSLFVSSRVLLLSYRNENRRRVTHAGVIPAGFDPHMITQSAALKSDRPALLFWQAPRL